MRELRPRGRSAIAPRAAEIRLIAVTKTHPVEPNNSGAGSGASNIRRENRVQEAKSKWPELRTRYPRIELHLIGPLQTNKVRDAVALFDFVHSLDRLRLAEALKIELQNSGRAVRLFVQVNTGEEPQKAGVAPKEAVDFVRHCRGQLNLPVIGLMCNSSGG